VSDPGHFAFILQDIRAFN